MMTLMRNGALKGAGQTIPNAVIVGLGPTGTIDIFSFAASHVIVDVVGYFA
jgi:hypothetical protein